MSGFEPIRHDKRQNCRDFTHLAITLCRCMNIPARYATGHLGDIGVPSDPNPMDFSAWFEAYLGGHWHTFDARHNRRRIRNGAKFGTPHFVPLLLAALRKFVVADLALLKAMVQSRESNSAFLDLNSSSERMPF